MFRPCIDLHDGKVKQIVGGSLSDKEDGLIENFVSQHSPAYYARLFQEDGLKGGHVIMLGKGNEAAAKEALAAYPGGLQVGGGITDANALQYLEMGASHVIVTSHIFKEGRLCFEALEKLVAVIGKERLVIDLSCRKRDGVYYVVTDRWQTFTDYGLDRENIAKLEGYCDEFLIHGVDVEGKQQGIDLELLKAIADWCTIPVTYAGGIRSLEDIDLIRTHGRGRIHYTVGSALDIFGGSLAYRTVVENQS